MISLMPRTVKYLPMQIARYANSSSRRRMPGSRLSNRLCGAVIVEVAICLPLLLLLVFGTLELNSGIFMSQTMTSAAHEGVLIGLQPGATETAIRERIDTVLESRGVEGYTVEFQPAGTDFTLIQPGEVFTVSIRNTRSNAFIDLQAVSVSVSAVKP